MVIPWTPNTPTTSRSKVTRVQVIQSNDFDKRNSRISTVVSSVTDLRWSLFMSRTNTKGPESGSPQDKDTRVIISSRDDFRLFLRPKWFVLFWWMVGIFRACEIAFLVAMIWLYFWLLWNAQRLIDSINDLTFDFGYSTLGAINWTFVFLAVLQSIMFVESLVFSVKARELTFTEYPAAGRTTESFHDALARSFSWFKPWDLVRKNWIEPVFFIHGKYFEGYFLFREYMEVVSQVYQAYQMSIYIPTRWINNLFVMMIFLNCISTPIIHWLVPSSNVPLRRLLSVVCSAFLNFVNTVIIPFIIFIPYPSQYDASWGSFETEYLYDDVWYARAIRQNQQLFVTSYVDFFATWAPHWSQLSCLVACGDLVRRSRCPLERRTAAVACVPAAPHSRCESRSPCTASQAKLPRKSLRLSKTKERVAYHGLWIVGVVVLAIHIASQSNGDVVGCKLQSTPWFVAETSCVVMNVNCYRHGIEGTEEELHLILSKLSSKYLFQLILAHCPKLQIPPIIRKFQELTGFDLYNSTLVQWHSEAALSATTNPKMIYMAMYLINMSGIPEGLLDHDFPQHLHSMDIYGTNLTTLPDNLHDYWPRMAKVFMDFCQLETFPSALANMPNLIQISLVGNRISSIVDATTLFRNERLQFLRLSDSTLSLLPAEVDGSMDHFAKLDLEYTQLSAVPQYIRKWYFDRVHNNEGVEHSLYGSPYCNVTLPEEDEEQRLYQSQVCAVDLKSGGPLYYFEVIKGQRLVETLDGI